MIAYPRSFLSSFSASISTRERTVLISRAEALIRPRSAATHAARLLLHQGHFDRTAHPIPVVLAIRVIQGQLADQHEVCLVRTLRQESRRRQTALEDSDELRIASTFHLTYDGSVGRPASFRRNSFQIVFPNHQEKIMKKSHLITKLLSMALFMFAISACSSTTKVESDLGLKGAPDWVNEGTNILCLLYTSPSPRD